MNRTYGDPIEVWTHDDGRPARFVWRSRLYTVLAVLDHSGLNRELGSGQSPGPSGRLARQFWRVRASAGRDAPRGIYELRHDTATNDWLLARTWE